MNEPENTNPPSSLSHLTPDERSAIAGYMAQIRDLFPERILSVNQDLPSALRVLCVSVVKHSTRFRIASPSEPRYNVL
jgi:hypothetical protein